MSRIARVVVWDVFLRKGGVTGPGPATITTALCSDGCGHAFAFRDEVGPVGAPACGAQVRWERPTVDADPVCPSCDGAALAWSGGARLGVPAQA